ncbi:MAG TPA: galactokinase, partial [Cyclobacteriaceae bacterium]|nr:galactokinase [Cyclobacteriaceae bacterium]
NKINPDEIVGKFREIYGGMPALTRSPGRINLIGEHTDYNDGFVLPGAIDKEVVLALKPNGQKKIRIYASDLDQSVEVANSNLKRNNKRWPNYLFGVVDQLQKSGYDVPGFDCLFASDIPIGAGLSSSAAIECGLAFALNELFGFKLGSVELAKLSLKAEQDFAGLNCGIMDQFANLFGKENQVIRLDCRSLDHIYFPLRLQDHEIILCDTCVKHSLASSEYNTRRKECEEGVAILKRSDKRISSLRDVSPAMITSHEVELPEKVFMRCRYVADEIRRVETACRDLEMNDINSFGAKMYETHAGLARIYEVSCDELDFLVEIAGDSGVTGSRMMGGGFGGCTINLVNREVAEAFIDKILKKYSRKFQIEPLIYRVNIKNGTSMIRLN